MAPHTLTPRNIEIRDNFDAIAPRYDLTNRVISFGVDRRWRRAAVRQLAGLPPGGTVLDLACGTCDVALEVLRQGRAARVVGADLSGAMLRLARRKLAGRGLAAPQSAEGRPGGARAAGPWPAGRDGAGGPAGRRAGAVDLVAAPAEALPFPDAAFDGVTIAFGIRNVPDFRAGLREMRRVLRPGGRAVILEFSTPPSRWLWRMYNYYFFSVLPRIGGLLTGREAAYRYLTRTVAEFPGPRQFAAAMEESGFAGVSWRSLNGGIVCIHTGVKP
jgi:demethylmenaquinone methyltransferase/2-methoxy-6-polyprenyl-1,4-benzoquinol methylase